MTAGPTLANLQNSLRKAFTEPRGVATALRRQPRLADWIESGPPIKLHTRIAIYADAYFSRLLGALEQDFSAVRRALGETRFRRLIADFLVAHPSRSPNLADLGRPFPDFLRSHDVLRDLPFLAELAELERRASEAVYTARLSDIDPAALSRLPADRWPQARITLDPTVQLLSFRWPVHRLWFARERADEKGLCRLRRPAASRLLVYRDDEWVRVQSLEEGAWMLLEQLSSGRKLGQAFEAISAASNVDPSAVQRWFAEWVHAGVIKRIRA